MPMIGLPETVKPLDTGPNRRLRELMEARNLTQKEIGDILNKQISTVNKYVSPTQPREISEGFLYKLQARLGFSKLYIEKGIEPRFVKPEVNIVFTEVSMLTSNRRNQIGWKLISESADFLPIHRLYDVSERDAEGLVVIEIALSDHMGEQLKPGTKVLAKRLDESEWETTTGVVGVLHMPGVFDIKRIINNTLPQNNSLTLVADGPKGGTYTLPRTSIREMYKLLTIIESPVE